MKFEVLYPWDRTFNPFEWPPLTDDQLAALKLHREAGWVCGIASEDGRTMTAYNEKTGEMLSVTVTP